jgi:hypothetical protein
MKTNLKKRFRLPGLTTALSLLVMGRSESNPLLSVFTRMFLRTLVCLVFVACSTGAIGGSVLFQNWKSWYDGSVTMVTNEQPVFLPDCQTRASGSNFVVELLAPHGQLLATTYLGEGDFAGLFSGCAVFSDLLPQCYNVLLTVRVWDLTTGTNFESATLRVASSFTNHILGGCGGGVPFMPEELTGFQSFALGNAQCFTNPTVVGFGDIEIGDVESVVSRSRPTAHLFLQRAGDLGQTNSVTYFTWDDTAKAGLNYVPATGTLTFAPGEVSKSITVQFLPESVIDQWLWVNVGLTNLSGNAQLGTTPVRTSVYDDRSVVRWIPASRTTNAHLEIRFIYNYYGHYPFSQLWVEKTANLVSKNWARVSTVKQGYQWDSYWSEWMDPDGIHYVLWPQIPLMQGPSTGFYRAAVVP